MATATNLNYPTKINQASTNTAGGVNFGPVIAITDKASGGAIGTAAATVDAGSVFNVSQTTSSQTLTIPAPTVTADSKTILVNNVGSTSFTVLSTVIAPGSGILANYTGSAWNVTGTSSGASNVTVAGGKTFTVSNTLTFDGTDGTTMTFPAVSGTVVTLAGTQTLTNKTLTSPTMTAPVLGVATATSLNGNTFTTGTYTLTGQAGKTLTFNGSITLTGTDAQTYTFPTTSATLARTDAANTFTGVQTMTSAVLITPAIGVATGTSLAVTGLLTSASPTAQVGFATGAGGAVSQDTDKSTGVTLNTNCGAITMNNASLAGAATVSFILTNSAIAATDVVTVCVKSGASTGLYTAAVTAVGAGSCTISVTNIGATAGEVVVLNFAVISAVAA